MVEAGGLHRRLAVQVRISCHRVSLSLCVRFGVWHREHEAVSGEQLYRLVA